jgi:hypothetical protein
MDKKKILIGVGFLALIGGVSYYFYNKSKKPNTGDTSEDSGSTKSTSASQESASAPAPSSESSTETATDSSTGTGIKGLKGSERRDFRKETRATCEEKYGRGIGSGYTKCKKRVKKGGVPFTGDFDEFEETYMDFDNNFDITF